MQANEKREEGGKENKLKVEKKKMQEGRAE